MSLPLSRGRLALLALPALLAGCTEQRPPAPEPPPAPVTVGPARTRTVPIQVRAIGTVEVVSTVLIRPRVGGELTKVHFREGDFVKRGDKLFTIDPRPYETALEQAQAQLDKDNAVLNGAEIDLQRAQQLSGTRAASRGEVDKLKTEVASARATIAADEAALRSAELQLGFTTITAPIDGYTGGLLVDAGNLVTADAAAPLVIINQVSPIYVSFAVPEQYLTKIKPSREKQVRPLPVEAVVRDEPPTAGKLAFIDNTVDAATGTIPLKATFPNKDGELWPGQFVEVVLLLDERPDSIVVPARAVQAGQNGRFVFVVKDGTAEYRPVEVAFEVGGEAVIAKGLKSGEVVVTDGHLRVAPGAKVAVKSEAAPKEGRPS